MYVDLHVIWSLKLPVLNGNFFAKFSNIKFNENPFSDSEAVLYIQMDKHRKLNRHSAGLNVPKKEHG
jgi:hypothetical protein